ncbi:MAG TPA: PsiF family protein [Burkholderiales bacterium]|nr:PsiF family protein [Burkholderiales bacterium]
MSKYLIAVMGGVMLAMVAGQGLGTPPVNKGNSAQQKQQERQNACSARANDKDLTGTARKDFISACLKGDPASAPK